MMNKLILTDFTKDNHIHYAENYFDDQAYGVTHSHTFYEIFFIVSGELLYTCNGNNVTLKSSDIHFVLPENEHGFIVSNPLKPPHLINIAFNGNLLDDKLQFALSGSLAEKKQLDIIKCRHNMYSIILNNSLLLKNSSSVLEKELILYSILTNYFIEYNYFNLQNDGIPIWLSNVMEDMKKPVNFITGIREFVKKSGKSQEYLTRQMQKHYKLTPSKFINNLRLEYAADLLLKTNKKVITIIYDSGFNNVSHFERLFKLKYNCTPNQYRNNNRDIFITK